MPNHPFTECPDLVGPRYLCFSKLLAESNAHQNLRTTVAGNRTPLELKKNLAAAVLKMDPKGEVTRKLAR